MELQLINLSPPSCMFKASQNHKTWFIWEENFAALVMWSPTRPRTNFSSGSLGGGNVSHQSSLINMLWEQSQSRRPSCRETLLDVGRSGGEIPKVSGSGESPEQNISEVCMQKKCSLAVTYLLLKCPLWLCSLGLQCRTAKCPAVCFHSSALIAPQLCQQQHDTAFQAASHTESEPARNNSHPKPFI